MPICQWNFRAFKKFQTRISWLWVLSISCSKTPVHLVNRSPGVFDIYLAFASQRNEPVRFVAIKLHSIILAYPNKDGLQALQQYLCLVSWVEKICDITWCDVMMWCDVMWCDGVVWCGMAWHGMAWCGIVWWSGVAWRGVAWCDVMWYMIQELGNKHVSVTWLITTLFDILSVYWNHVTCLLVKLQLWCTSFYEWVHW